METKSPDQIFFFKILSIENLTRVFCQFSATEPYLALDSTSARVFGPAFHLMVPYWRDEIARE
jgi:hypothetical protein